MRASLPPDEADRLDALTGFYTRHVMLDEIAKLEVARARHLGHPLTAALIDIDKFKTINDIFGRPVGDAVLRAIGQACKNALRAPDVIARYGGAELAVLLPGTGVSQAAPALDRLRKSIMAMLVPELCGKWVVTASIGAAEMHKDDAEIAAVLARADAALYRAKETGRNKIELAQAA